MVAALLAGFDLAQLDAGIPGGVPEHGDELVLRGKMAAGAGGQVAAPGQQPHGPVVDLLVAGDGVGHGFPGLGEGRRVQDDEIVPGRLLFQRRQQIKDIGGNAVHHIRQAVARGIGPGHLHRRLGDIHSGDMGGPALCRVQREGAGVGKAVENRVPLGHGGNRPAVVFLIQEEAGFLSVLHIHQILDPVFGDFRDGRFRDFLPGQREPALVLGHALLLPEGHIVALEDTADCLSVLPEDAHQHGDQHPLDPLHAHGEHLHAEQVVKFVHRQPGEGIRLAENHPAAVQILRAHDGPAVVPGPAELAFPEGFVKPVVGVPGDQPDPDFGQLGQKAGAEIPALFAQHIHKAAVFGLALDVQNFRVVDPGMPPQQRRLSLGCDGITGVAPIQFHSRSSRNQQFFPIIPCSTSNCKKTAKSPGHPGDFIN